MVRGMRYRGKSVLMSQMFRVTRLLPTKRWPEFVALRWHLRNRLPRIVRLPSWLRQKMAEAQADIAQQQREALSSEAELRDQKRDDMRAEI